MNVAAKLAINKLAIIKYPVQHIRCEKFCYVYVTTVF